MAEVMGILNVTPDSFSDGGKHARPDEALGHAIQMLDEGASIIDVGGESSRPGAKPISVQEEIERVAPVIERLTSETQARVSVDTRHFEVAEIAVGLGACIVNDITAGRDPRLIGLMKRHPIDLILMHMQGEPETMQRLPHYPGGVVQEVTAFLADRVRAFEEAGIDRSRLWVDPGIGFGKSLDHNLELLSGLKKFRTIAGAVVIGTSRKSFLGAIIEDSRMELREAGTLASNLWALTQGASVLRVHEVGPMVRALKTWEAIWKR